MNKSVGIITFEDYRGRENIGSSRIRARWLVNYWPEAELFITGRKYEAVIFQKVYWLQYAHSYDGIKILDICDPDFLNWRRDLRQMAEYCDAVAVSTDALADAIKTLTSRPVVYIPDRLDPQDMKGLRKDHKGNGDAKTVAWYGYYNNFSALDSIVDVLPDLGIKELVVVSDRPYADLPTFKDGLSLINCMWRPDTVYDDLLRADIVINPKIFTGRWKYKSNNKSITAWALGLPVAHNREELAALISEEARIKEAELRGRNIFETYHVRRSVDEYRCLIRELGARKHNRLYSRGKAA